MSVRFRKITLDFVVQAPGRNTDMFRYMKKLEKMRKPSTKDISLSNYSLKQKK